MAHWLQRNKTLLTLALATIGTLVGLAQAWVSITQDSPIGELRAASILELREQIQQRKTALKAEVESLDKLAKELASAELALTGSPPDVVPPVVEVAEMDPWWATALKTIAVYFALSFTVLLTIFAFFADLIALLFNQDFVFTRGLWDLSWSQTTIDWYWDKGTFVGRSIGIALLVFLAIIGQFVDRRNPQVEEPGRG